MMHVMRRPKPALRAIIIPRVNILSLMNNVTELKLRFIQQGYCLYLCWVDRGPGGVGSTCLALRHRYKR